MADVLYSIIIPHKNIPSLLDRCLSSIPEREDVQIIVVDDNSDPGIVDFYHFPGAGRNSVEVIFDKKGLGAGHARNVGLAKARGKWLLFADADDFFCDGFLSILDKYNNMDVDILYYSIASVDSDTLAPSNREMVISENVSLAADGNREAMDRIMYLYRAPWFKMMSKSFVDKYGLYFEHVPVGNDCMLSLCANYMSEKRFVIRDQLYTVTYRRSSITFKNRSPKEFAIYFNNRIKRNNFYKYIGKSFFCERSLREILSYLKQGHIRNFINALLSFGGHPFMVFRDKDHYINVLNTMINKH